MFEEKTEKMSIEIIGISANEKKNILVNIDFLEFVNMLKT